MRRLALAAGLVLLVFPAQASAITSSCAATRTTTVRENSVARVYEDGDRSLFVCSKRTGHREFLMHPDGRVWQLRLRGHYVAFASESCLDAAGEEDCLVGLEVYDARSGKETFREINGRGADRIVLKRNGAIAWGIDYGDNGDGVIDGAIFKRDRDGRRRLQRARGVDPRSLQLRGSTLSWTFNGERRTAPLR